MKLGATFDGKREIVRQIPTAPGKAQEDPQGGEDRLPLRAGALLTGMGQIVTDAPRLKATEADLCGDRPQALQEPADVAAVEREALRCEPPVSLQEPQPFLEQRGVVRCGDWFGRCDADSARVTPQVARSPHTLFAHAPPEWSSCDKRLYMVKTHLAQVGDSLLAQVRSELDHPVHQLPQRNPRVADGRDDRQHVVAVRA